MATFWARKRLIKQKLIHKLLSFGLALGLCFGLSAHLNAQSSLNSQAPSAQGPLAISFKVIDRPVAPINERLLGHFLERASWGEPGPEIALQPGTRRIEPKAVELMAQLNIPIIRFPGGTDVDYTDWRDLISNVPGRTVGRPLTTGHAGDLISNQFGLDEYFGLRDQLRAEQASVETSVETILVVNFLEALSRQRPLEEALLNAAGLVAYVNAPVGAALPAGMPDWPAIRAKNGHEKPYHVEYLQIGNELWNQRFRQQVREGSGLSDPAELADWYVRCLRAYIDAITAVDPDITLMVDGTMGDGIERRVLRDEKIRDRIQYVTFHDYAPGPINNLKRAGEPVAASTLSDTDWWHAWVAMPGRFTENAESVALGNRIDFVRDLGYKIAVTEWNWNGWGVGDLDLSPDVNWRLASGLGTAGFLHGLMRQGNDIEIACQSLLVGANWDITSIRVDPNGEEAPYYLPQGQMMLFYSQHHGSTLLDLESANVPHYQQPFSMGWVNSPTAEVATLDGVATADAQRVYLHVINRSFDQALPLTIDLSTLPNVGNSVVQHLFSEKNSATGLKSIWRLITFRSKSDPPEVGEISAQSLPIQDGSFTATLPAQSVSIFSIEKTSIAQHQ